MSNKNNFNLKKDGFQFLNKCISLNYIKELQLYSLDLIFFYFKKNNLFVSKQKNLEILMSHLEQENKEDFYNYCKIIANSIPAKKICTNKNILSLIKKLFQNNHLSNFENAAFFNNAKVKRLQYKWHKESSYYKSNSDIITLWYPWVNNANKKNGTMIIAKNSHKKEYQYKITKKKNHLTQMEIDARNFKKDDLIYCNLNLGDAVIFSSHSAHKTGDNLTNKSRITMISRYTDSETIIFNT